MVTMAMNIVTTTK